MKHVGYGRYDVEVNGQVVGRAVKRPEGWEATGAMPGVSVTVHGHDSLESACMAIGRALGGTGGDQLKARVMWLRHWIKNAGRHARILKETPAQSLAEHDAALLAEVYQLRTQVERLQQGYHSLVFVKDKAIGDYAKKMIALYPAQSLAEHDAALLESVADRIEKELGSYPLRGRSAVTSIIDCLREDAADTRGEASPQTGIAPKEPCTCGAATDPQGMHAPWCPWMGASS